MIKKVTEIWKALSPTQKKTVKFIFALILFVAVVLLADKTMPTKKYIPESSADAKKEVLIGDVSPTGADLNKTAEDIISTRLKALEEQNERTEKELKEQKELLNKKNDTIIGLQNRLASPKMEELTVSTKHETDPEKIMQQKGEELLRESIRPPQERNRASSNSEHPQQQTAAIDIGQTTNVGNPFFKGDLTDPSVKPKEKEVEEIVSRLHLPSGTVIPAFSISGLRAHTTNNAKTDQEPYFLEIIAPALLPSSNSMKRPELPELIGCTIQATGYGDIQSERIGGNAIEISCTNLTEGWYIEQPILGIVQDADGITGLAGRVVWPAGDYITKAAVAKAIEATGKAITASTQTTLPSLVGTQQQSDPKQVARTALGGFIEGGSQEIADIYKELMKRSSPTIESLPGKDHIAVILQEGVMLLKKKLKSDESDEHEKN